MNFSSSLGMLRLIGFLEGCSFLLFGITMPLKYAYDMPEANKWVGMVHGILFIAYILLVFLVGRSGKWSVSEKLYAYVASFVPFGTFVADAKIFKKKAQLQTPPVRNA